MLGSDGSAKCTGRYQMSCRPPMEGWGGGDDRLKPGYGEFWLARTSRGGVVSCPPVGFQGCQAPPVTGTCMGRIGNVWVPIDVLRIGTAASRSPTTGDQPSGMQNMASRITGLTLSGPCMAPQTRLGVEGPLLNRVAAIRRLLNNRVFRTDRTAPTEPWDRPCR